ncbi:MAG TPA: TIR domain-containing protein [Allosphingosinicella sp.]|jgi:predicted nucleotide-binding protein
MAAFFGPEQQHRRLEALCLQNVVLNDELLAAAIENEGEPLRFEEGEMLLRQGDDDDDVYFLLAGFVDLEIHGHPYLRREAREVIGEMAALEPGSRRSATARAGSGGVVAVRLSCEAFMRLGAIHTNLWRNVARELSGRLRQRNAYFVPPNPIPKIFIASSGLAKPVIEVLHRTLSKPNMDIRLWTHEGIFLPSCAPMEALEEQARTIDFAIIVATADDKVTKNFLKPWRQTGLSARDNVLVEFGLFAGALDRRRVFVLAEENAKLALPSDLGGLTTLRFKNLADVERRAGEMERRIEALGSIHRVRAALIR